LLLLGRCQPCWQGRPAHFEGVYFNNVTGTPIDFPKAPALTVVEDDAELLDQLRDPDYPGKVERSIVFTLEAWDINCPQHIHKRFSQRDINPVIDGLKARIAELEAALEVERNRHN
jgi:hypothetical protein